MASCRVGRVYIIETAIARPPKPKFAVCVCIDPRELFVWINTAAPHHGHDQIVLPSGCHELIRHDSHLDLSRIIAHPEWELEGAREFEQLPRQFAMAAVDAIDAGLRVLSPVHAAIVRAGLATLCP